MIGVIFYMAQIGHLTQKGNWRGSAHMFGHPKPNICPPGHQCGLRVLLIPLCQFIAGKRAEYGI